jgi:thiol-disulfide isomerase/thioredoxin
MKRAVILTMMLAIYAFSAIPGISFEKFQKIRHKLNRPVVIFVYSPSCLYCKREAIAIDRDEKLKSLIRKKFVLVYANVKDPNLRPPFSTPERVPAFFVVEPKTLRLFSEPAIGAVPTEALREWLEEIAKKISDRKQNLLNRPQI